MRRFDKLLKMAGHFVETVYERDLSGDMRK